MININIEKRNINILVLSQLISNIGWWVTTLALHSFALYYREFDSVDYGFMMFFNTLPIILFGYLGGKISDYYNKKHLLVIVELLRGVVVFLIPFSENIYMLWFLVFLNTTLFTLFKSTLTGMVKELFSEEEYLLKANSWLVNCRNIGMVGGPAILSLLLASENWVLPFHINSITYILSSVSLIFLKFNAYEDIKEFVNKHINILDIIALLRKNIEIKIIFRYMLLYSIVSGVYNAAWFIFVINYLQLPAEYTGIFQIYIGIGSILMGVAINKIRKKINIMNINFYAIITYVISIVLISFSTNISMLQFTLIFLGAAFSAFMISFNTAIHLNVDKQYISRVASMFHSIQVGIQLLWALLIGFIVRIIDVSSLFFYISLGVLLSMCILKFISYSRSDN